MHPNPSPSPQESLQSPRKTIAVWDLPLRLFHWLLVGLIVAATVTGKLGGNAMDLHQQAGFGIAILVLFRLLWGCVGTTHARFGSFVRGLPAILAYCRSLLRGGAAAVPGHNPLGGWMVVVMLAVLAIQAGTGLFANDDIMTEGPLFNVVGKDTSDYLTALHKLNFKVLAGLAGLHVLAIAFYRLVKGINLVGPMITGRMGVADPAIPDAHISGRANLLALVLLAGVAGGFYFLVLRA